MTPSLLWALLALLGLGIPGLALMLGRGTADPVARFRLRPLRRLCGLLMLALGLSVATLLVSTQRFLQVVADHPVAWVTVHEQGPQAYRVRVSEDDGEGTVRSREFLVQGDAWQIDARVLRWRLPAALAGVPARYQLDRLGGRYQDIEQERHAPRTVHALSEDSPADLWSIKHRFSRWLPFVDAQYGSATWMPMLDGARYQVLFNARGGLLARPADTHTERQLEHAIGQGRF